MNVKSDVNEIIVNLWLGNREISLNKNFIIRNKINVIINCTKTSRFINKKLINHDIIFYRVSVRDDKSDEEIETLYNHFNIFTYLIYNHLLNGDKILIHCVAGRQRSVGLIISFFMRYTGLNYKKILEMIQSKRSIAGKPMLNFEPALIKYEKYLNNKKNTKLQV